MIRQRSRTLSAALAGALLLTTFVEGSASPASPGAPQRRRELAAAEAVLRQARWTGSLPEIADALARRDRADSAYTEALRSMPPAASIPVLSPLDRTGLLFDAIERGAINPTAALLRGLPATDPTRQVVHALVRSRQEGPRAGLDALAAFHAAGAHGSPSASDAGLFLAAALADSLDEARVRRAALWQLAAEGRPAAARHYARVALVRALAARGEPRLGREILIREGPATTEEVLLLAEIVVGGADTLGAVRILVGQAARGSLPAAERYACASRAARLAAAVRDSIAEQDWLGLLRALGDLGEAPTALGLAAVRRAPGDPAAALARSELGAALLLKARRFEESARAYRVLLARPGGEPAPRAGYALGLARSLRGTRVFAAMDSAFLLAVTLDPKSTTAETASWERAREWEDSRPPREAAEQLTWALPTLRSPGLRSAARIHTALALERAGAPDSARASLGGGEGVDAGVHLWRGLLALAGRDSASARRSLRSAVGDDPTSYEGIRARELLRAFPDEGRGEAPAASGPPGPRPRWVAVAPDPSIRLLRLVGFVGLEQAELRECARTGTGPDAAGCVDALEQLGVYRAGRVAAPWEARFRHPPAFARAVLRAAAAESLPAALLWAIMRQESAYEPKARSRAGALGLLQLLPSTAGALAGRRVPADSLTDPDLNVALGARYVRALAREFGDPRAVMAAFNAGEEAVRRWIAARGSVDDRWVELIPYRETRDYVKQVYAAWRRYESIYASNGNP